MILPKRHVRWTLTLAVALVATVSLFWGLGRWPWGEDEVDTLQELQLHSTAETGYFAPGSQAARLPRLVPVWYWSQYQILSRLPITEWNARLLPAVCGIGAILAAFTMAARRYGVGFALCLALMINASPIFLALSQQNRFYSMAILLLLLTEWSIWSERSRGAAGFVCVMIVASAAVLCHNLLLVVFALGTIAAGIGYVRGWVPKGVLIRSSLATAVGGFIYIIYLRPLTRGWNDIAGPQSTPGILVSFASEAGIPTLALALVGGALPAIRRRDREFRWWALLAILSWPSSQSVQW